MDTAAQELFSAALAARARAYVPYSGYAVGAAVRTANGSVYAGCNVENAAYPQGTCAEAAAIAAMVLAGEQEIVAVLTVTEGDEVGTCCGGCRQRIREFAADSIPVLAADLHDVRHRFTLGELLPHSFGPGHLGIHESRHPNGDAAT